MVKTQESFIGTVWSNGDSLVVTIPVNNVKFSGLKAGDFVKIFYNKEVKQE